MGLFTKKTTQPEHTCIAGRVHLDFDPHYMLYTITAQCRVCGKLQSMKIEYDAINDLTHALMG